MPIKILMPALSPTMEHGTLAKWLKKEGDSIEPGEVIAEIETDKATMEVEAVDEGFLSKILVPEGSNEVPVNSLIAVLLEEGEEDADIDAFISSQGDVKDSSADSSSEVEDAPIQQSDQGYAQEKLEEANISKIDSDESINAARIFASPLAKRIAENESIDLTKITGSGPHGRIVKDDLSNISANKLESLNTTFVQATEEIGRNSEEYTSITNSTMRKVIAKRLTESKQTVPHFYLSIECMMDSLLEARVQINSLIGDDKSKRISVNDFIIAASAKALRDVPEANASWGKDAIKMYNNVDISVAVAIEGGLITPIVKNADQKNIKTISLEMKDLATRARNNALKPEEFQGGGFSISNLGMYGVKNFNAIVNPPQGCILAVGASNKRAIVVNDNIEIKTVMDVNLSCDHRVVDGAVAAEFLKAFKKYIEAPITLFI